MIRTSNHRVRVNRPYALAAALFVGSCLCAGARAGECTELYHVTPLEPLPGGFDFGIPYAINEAGQLAGESIWSNYEYMPNVWTTDGRSVLIGDFPGGLREAGGAYAINNAGHAAGAGTSVSGTEAFYWTSEGGLVAIGDLPGGVFGSVAYGINDVDQVVGYGCSPKGNQAFIWDPVNGRRALGEFAGGQFLSMAFDINNQGQVVGHSAGLRGSEAFIWDEVNGMRPLGDFPPAGYGARAFAINELGQIAGLAATTVGGQGYIWDPKEGFTLIGHLAGTNPWSVATALNDRGQVVGQFADNVPIRPEPGGGVIWDREHGLRLLDGLLAADTPPGHRHIRQALGINNRGQIAVFTNADASAAVLTPFTLADLNCDGTVNTFDIDGFILTLGAAADDDADGAEYAEKYPGCHGDWAADANQDGSVNLFDIAAFMGMLGG